MAKSTTHGDSVLKKHRAVIKDFFRQQLTSMLGYTLTTAALIAAYLTSGAIEHELLRWTGLVVLLLVVMLIARVISVYVIAPTKYMEQIQSLPQEQQKKLPREYPFAKKVGQHRYLGELLIFFTQTRIFVVRYEDITGVSSKKHDLLVRIKGREAPLLLPCHANGVSPVVYAYLRSKNPDIKIIGKADGKEISE